MSTTDPLIEVRGLGLVSMPFESNVPVALIVSISDAVNRMPDDLDDQTIAGVILPRVQIMPLEASAPIKVELMLKARGLA